MNRQVNFLLNNYKYKPDGEDTENLGLLIPRYIATGRLSPEGKVYKEVQKRNESDLVPVRSIVTKTKGNLNEVTPDLFSKRFKEASFPDDSAVGVSLGSSFSESTTQSILGLKHGGHERIQDLSGNLYAPKKCQLVEEGKWIILKVRGDELKFPRPESWVNMGKTEYEAGELVGTAYHTTSPVYKLNAVIKLMSAKSQAGKKYYEKDKLIVSDCYAYEEGTIHYKETKYGLEVVIGSRTYVYSPEAMYYYPEGTRISQYQRFCSGIVDMRQVTYELPNDVNAAFTIFRDQYYLLTSKSFAKDHIVSPGDMQEEIVELVFAGLTQIVPDIETGEIESVKFQGTQSAILGRDSFFTTLSYGWSGPIIGKALKGELNLKDDIMTETVLGLLLNNDLDKTGK